MSKKITKIQQMFGEWEVVWDGPGYYADSADKHNTVKVGGVNTTTPQAYENAEAQDRTPCRFYDNKEDLIKACGG